MGDEHRETRSYNQHENHESNFLDLKRGKFQEKKRTLKTY